MQLNPTSKPIAFPQQMPADTSSTQSLRIAGWYALFATLWILFSDQAVAWVFTDPFALTIAASVKGCCFVAVTAAMLYLLVRRQLKRANATLEAQDRAEAAVRVSEERFRSLASLSPDIISIFDREGHLVFNSAAAYKIHGYRDSDLLGVSTFDLIHPDDRGIVQAAFASALSDPDNPVVVRYRYRNANGSYTWMEASARNELDNPHLQGVISISRDISERVQAEEALRESEAHMRRAEKMAGVGHWTLYLGSKEMVASEGARQIYGILHSRMSLAEVELAPLPEYRAKLDAAMKALVEEGLPYDVQFKIRRISDGKIVDVCSHAQFEPTRRVIFGTIQDISERKNSEARLHLESAALAAAANAIAITDRAGCLVWVNPAFTTLTGYTEEEVSGRTLGQLLGSGKHDKEFFKVLWNTILAGKPWHGEICNRRKDGTLYTEEQTITPVLDEQGEIAHFVAIKQDISGRKSLEAQVYRSQRLESVGRLAGGIAHDLNNILVPMLVAPTILRDAVTDPAVLPILNTIETSARRGSSIIKQLLIFSRGGKEDGKRVMVQWRHVLDDMMLIMRETFPKNINFKLNSTDRPWLIEADSTQLHQVVMNLCVNARDAMPEGGTLSLELDNIEMPESFLVGWPEAKAGPYVLLTVADTGSGISPEILDKVFDPFFTTKEVGKGTGLGLSTVLGIVRSHRGLIQISSKPGEGSQFRVYLPASRIGTETIDTQEIGTRLKGQGECILLVDDEEHVRVVVMRILERHGYSVITASNGAEGLALFRQKRQDIAAVITDLIMPVMDGMEMIQQILSIDPGTRIIAISGHEGDLANSLKPVRSLYSVLSKPFTTETLLTTLHKVLRSS